MEALIEVRGVRKVYPHRSTGRELVALRDVDVDIMPNEFVCLLGPSGCGKTTLLKIMDAMEPGHAHRSPLHRPPKRTARDARRSGRRRGGRYPLMAKVVDVAKQDQGPAPEESLLKKERTGIAGWFVRSRVQLLSIVLFLGQSGL